MHVISLAVVVVRRVGDTTNYLVRRAKMKRRDEEIEQERRREEERENEQQETTTLTHFSHGCPLTENNRPANVNCDACNKTVSGAPGGVFTCERCKVFLHKVCTRNPVTFAPCMDRLAQQMSASVYEPTTIETFAHSEHHVKEIYSNVDYTCKHCFTPGCGKRFQCKTCKVNLHSVCATSPTKISSFMHPEHELNLKTKRHFKDCAICHRNMGQNIRLYRCKECSFYVHPACSQLPQYLLHELHPLSHPLKLKPADCSRRCNAKCGNHCKSGRWCYECQICEVSFHVGCLQKHSLKHYMPSTSEKTRVDVFIQLLTIVERIVRIDDGVIRLTQDAMALAY